MTTRAMPMFIDGAKGKFLELRNSADEAVIPSTQLKTGEDAREAARRAAEEFFGLMVPDGAIREGWQARVGTEVVALYPIDVSLMDMSLLRPAESAASWAWRDVPDSMGKVVALGFPRNVERRNTADLAVDDRGTRAGAGVARTNGLVNVFGPASATDFHPAPAAAHADQGEARAQYALLQDSVAAKAAALRDAPAHERHARAEELAQETDNLRLLAADMGVEAPARLNAADAPAGPLTARALIRQNDGTIIAARQKDGRSLLPGGHIENGETPEGAVARELQEELGLDIRQAMTGESYDFHGQDGSSHRVFVVDGAKLDLAGMTPGDDVEDAEIVSSPFTDSHGAVHPQPATAEQVGDVAEIERHVEGIQHEVGELERENAGGEEKRKKVMEEFAAGTLKDPQGNTVTDQKQALAIAYSESGERKNGSATCNECGRSMTADGKGGWVGHAPGCSTATRNNAASEKEWWCLDCGTAITAKDREPGGAHEKHKTQLVEKKDQKRNGAEAGDHGHQYPDRMNGAFPVLICGAAAEETIATQETTDGWRCEACGAVIAGPPRPEQVIEA